MEKRLEEIESELRKINILIRTNNLLLSRFILQLSTVRKELGLPKRNVFFKFELLQEDYEELVLQFGKQEVDKALYRLDRLLLTNKQQCPNNIKKYLVKKLTSRKQEQRSNND